MLFAFGVEQEIVAGLFVSSDVFKVFSSGNGERFDQPQSGSPERMTVFRRFIAMQLDIIQTETVGKYFDLLFVFVDKDTDTLCFDRHVGRKFVEATGRFRIEDEAYHVHL